VCANAELSEVNEYQYDAELSEVNEYQYDAELSEVNEYQIMSTSFRRDSDRCARIQS
jgi:hypothetical protein